MTRKEFNHKVSLIRFDLGSLGYGQLFEMKYLPRLEAKLNELDETWEKR